MNRFDFYHYSVHPFKDSSILLLNLTTVINALIVSSLKNSHQVILTPALYSVPDILFKTFKPSGQTAKHIPQSGLCDNVCLLLLWITVAHKRIA
jgi:hypothetical protein